MYRIANIFRLDRKVLAVAVEDGTDWTAYVGAVPGVDHAVEAEEIKCHGTKLPEELAKVMFPGLAKVRRWAV